MNRKEDNKCLSKVLLDEINLNLISCIGKKFSLFILNRERKQIWMNYRNNLIQLSVSHEHSYMSYPGQIQIEYSKLWCQTQSRRKDSENCYLPQFCHSSDKDIDNRDKQEKVSDNQEHRTGGPGGKGKYKIFKKAVREWLKYPQL